MAKLSVNSAEVVGDDGLIDWNRIANKPALVLGANITTRLETVGSGIIQAFSFYLENDGTGKVRMVRRTTLTNCDCDCVCDCP